jgi:hypothetical protein
MTFQKPIPPSGIFYAPIFDDPMQYLTNVKLLGECPEHSPKVLLDTGSSDFWLLSSGLCNCLPMSNTETLTQNRRVQEMCDSLESPAVSPRNITYEDGFWVSGYPHVANILFDDTIIWDTQFIAVTNKNKHDSMTGTIGLSLDESYSAMPYVLKERGSQNLLRTAFTSTGILVL